MIPTGDSSRIALIIVDDDNPFDRLGVILGSDRELYDYDSCTQTQHIHILSREPRKAGDWSVYYGTVTNYNGMIRQETQDIGESDWQKVIATTNPDLIKEGIADLRENYDILKEFKEAYNHGNPMDNVLVEYEEKCRTSKCRHGSLMTNRHPCKKICAHTILKPAVDSVGALKINLITGTNVHLLKGEYGSNKRTKHEMDIIYAVTMVAQEMGHCKGSEDMKKWNDATTGWIKEHLHIKN